MNQTLCFALAIALITFVPERLPGPLTEEQMDSLSRYLVDTETGERIPPVWFLSHGLAAETQGIAQLDSDEDGFLNQDEWRSGTDPANKDSHPRYITKLFLSRWIKVPFRMQFQRYIGDIDKPEKMQFQIRLLEVQGRRSSGKIGGSIEGTNYKITGFVFKQALDQTTGNKMDVSELTVRNSDTQELGTLILDRVIDFPHQYAEFRYRWNVKSDQNGELLVAPKLSELSLKPSIDERYTIVDVTNTEAVLETSKGEKLAVKPYVRKWPPGSGGR